jgi:hypothetical protein
MAAIERRSDQVNTSDTLELLMKTRYFVISAVLLVLNLVVLIHYWCQDKDGNGNVIHHDVRNNVVNAKDATMLTVEVLGKIYYTGTNITNEYVHSVRGFGYFVRTIPDWTYYVVYSQTKEFQGDLPAHTRIQAWFLPLNITTKVSSFADFPEKKDIPEGDYVFLTPVDTINVIAPPPPEAPATPKKS